MLTTIILNKTYIHIYEYLLIPYLVSTRFMTIDDDDDDVDDDDDDDDESLLLWFIE
jgi:hypothetical protein